MVKAAGYHGVEGVKTVKRVAGASGEVLDAIPVQYAINLALSPSTSETARFADNRRVLIRVSDNGYTGTFGFSAQDPALEEAAGTLRSMQGGGIARVSGRGEARFDTYYEFIESLENGADRKVKVWILNHTFGKPDVNHATDEESIAFGDYTYPVTVYGAPAAADDNGTPWVDENGMGTHVFMLFARPDDANYKTFGDSVPKPILPAAVQTT